MENLTQHRKIKEIQSLILQHFQMSSSTYLYQIQFYKYINSKRTLVDKW